jgi:hypothetical protein
MTVIKTRMVKQTRNVEHIREMKDAYKVLLSLPEQKSSSGRGTSKWDNNIKMDLVACIYVSRHGPWWPVVKKKIK